MTKLKTTANVNNRRTRRLLVLAALLAPPAAAQTRLFPRTEAFEYPFGSTRLAAISGRVVEVSRGESRYGAEREADVSIGDNLPVLGFGTGPRSGFLGLTIRVSGRFSLDDPRSALVSNDWVAGLHGVVDRGPWRVAAELYHESSHLGDEYAERFGARRLDWTREVASLSARRALGPIFVHAVGSYTLVDALPLDPAAVGAGIDYRGDLGEWLGARVRPVVGVFGESQQFAGWLVTTSGRAGIDLDRGGRRVGVGLVFVNGLSTQRQFYDRRSRYAGVELRFDW